MDPLEVRRWLLYFYCIRGELTQGHKLLLRWRCGSGPEIPAGIWQVQTWPCSGAEPHLTPKAWPLLPWVLMGYSHSVCASKGWSLTIALNSVFLMDHHCLSFLLTHFGNWVLHLEEPSFLCVCLLLFVTSEVVPALLPDIQGFLPQGTAESQPCKIKWSKLVWGFPPHFGYQLLPKNCLCQVWFSHSGSLGGFTGSGEPCPCAVIPWGWRQGCCAALILSQNNPAGCVPDQILPVPAAPGVVRLDSSLVGEADSLS